MSEITITSTAPDGTVTSTKVDPTNDKYNLSTWIPIEYFRADLVRNFLAYGSGSTFTDSVFICYFDAFTEDYREVFTRKQVRPKYASYLLAGLYSKLLEHDRYTKP